MGFPEIKARRKKLGKPQKLYREILFTDNAEEVSHWLSALVKEMSREKGGEYTLKDSLYVDSRTTGDVFAQTKAIRCSMCFQMQCTV